MTISKASFVGFVGDGFHEIHDSQFSGVNFSARNFRKGFGNCGGIEILFHFLKTSLIFARRYGRIDLPRLRALVVGISVCASYGGGYPLLFADFFLKALSEPFGTSFAFFCKFLVKCFCLVLINHENKLFLDLSALTEVLSATFFSHFIASLVANHIIHVVSFTINPLFSQNITGVFVQNAKCHCKLLEQSF
nr:MAG TPA: hypothetical protein [Caudoviricetes sp.]